MNKIKNHIKQFVRFIQSLFGFFKFQILESKKINNAEVVFILPYFQTGGAERVHLNIVKSVKDKKSCILFTHNSATDNFKEDFSQYSEIIEINKILSKNNNFINSLLKKHIAKTINNNQALISVFSSNTNFFYELLPLVKEHIITVDLIHAISGENPILVNHYIASSHDITNRVVINNKAYNDILLNYKKYKVDNECYNKVIIIENAIGIDNNEKLNNRDGIKIGFVGRWSKEKRPEMFLKISAEITKVDTSIKFVMAGIGMKSNIKMINESGVSFLGEITDDITLNQFYKSLTFVLITSFREGFPMVIPEAMAQGVIPISTNVGGISEHIMSFENGILIDDDDENEIVNQFVDIIIKLINDKELVSKLSLNAFNYSRKHFDIEAFNKKYRKTLLKELYS